MAAYDLAKQDPNVKYPCKVVEQQHLAGYYRCCVFKWRRSRERDRWSLICRCAPKLAKSYKEIPNVLRKLMGRKLKFSSRIGHGRKDGTTSTLPKEFQDVVAESVASRPLKLEKFPLGSFFPISLLLISVSYQKL